MIMNGIRRIWRQFLGDTLFRNSIYLMLSTLISGGLGFIFWMICTHIFSPEQIGVGTALISAMALISTIGLLGFNSTFVRVLPNSTNRDNEISTGSLLVIAASAIMAIVYVLLIPYIAPSLGIARENFWYAAGFVIVVALASINALTDSVFIAYRSAQYALITDAFITSGGKLLLPLVFVALGAYGVFFSAGLATSVGMVASVLYMIFVFGYKPRFKIDIETLKSVFNYSFTNYIANLLNMVPAIVLPIIILDHLGAPAEGYYYLAFMIINLIYAVANSIAQSLFAEGSYSDQVLRDIFTRAGIILVAIMIPACIVLCIFGPFVLGFFGKSYSDGGSEVIILLAISAPIIAMYNMGGVFLKITKQMYSMILVNFIYAISVVGLTWFWVGKGLLWVAIAWTVGNLIAALVALILGLYHHWQHLATQKISVV